MLPAKNPESLPRWWASLSPPSPSASKQVYQQFPAWFLKTWLIWKHGSYEKNDCFLLNWERKTNEVPILSGVSYNPLPNPKIIQHVNFQYCSSQEQTQRKHRTKASKQLHSHCAIFKLGQMAVICDMQTIFRTLSQRSHNTIYHQFIIWHVWNPPINGIL